MPQLHASRVQALQTFGQSPWCDQFSGQMLQSGELRRLIEDDGIVGLTSNLTIFQKAMIRGGEYDDDLIAPTLGANLTGARAVFAALGRVGIDMEEVATQLVDLLLRVPPLGHVALQLPLALELFFRIEPDLEVEHAPDARYQEGVQPLDDDHISRSDLFVRTEGAVPVVVDRFQDRIAPPQGQQLILHQRKVVGPGIQRGDPHQLAFPPVEAVVIIQAKTGDPVFREDAVKTRRKRRLAAAAVTADGDEDGALHPRPGCGSHHSCPAVTVTCRPALRFAASPSSSRRNESANSLTPWLCREIAARQPDVEAYIAPQRRFADLVVRFYRPEDDGEDEHLNVRIIQRASLPRLNLGGLLDNPENGLRAVQGEDDHESADILEIEGRIDPGTVPQLEDRIWEHIDARHQHLRHLAPDQFGDFTDGIMRKHHSDPLALTQLLLVHRILSAKKSMLLKVPLSVHESIIHDHEEEVAHDHEHV